MKTAGKILHYTKNKMFIIQAKDRITPETIILNDKGRKVGKVIDVIGPINKPFLVVKPLIENPEKYVGGEVYYVKRRRK